MDREQSFSSSTPDVDYIYHDKSTYVTSSTFIDDALKYRSIFHKIDPASIKLYHFYFSSPTQWLLLLTVTLLHLLAFVETPSSMTWSSDIRIHPQRWQAPFGVLESVEFCLLTILLIDAIVKSYLIGKKRTLASKWIIVYYVVLVLSFIDLTITFSLGTQEVWRVRRLLRPFFILQRSSLMKKVWNCLRRTMIEILSVLLLLLTHLYFFTLFGMLLFPTPHNPASDISPNNLSTPSPNNQSSPPEDDYFRSFNQSFINLLVLLTTANNPDVMMPAYQKNRFYALYFIIFLVIGLYCIMNMLTAVIYNQFRGYFKDSMQASLFRRRLGILAAYEVLRHRKIRMGDINMELPSASGGVPKVALKEVALRVKFGSKFRHKMAAELDKYPEYITHDQLQRIVDAITAPSSSKTFVNAVRRVENATLSKIQYVILHRGFGYLCCFIIASNVIAISVLFSIQYDLSLGSAHSNLHSINLAFNVIYVLEKLLLIWAHGWRKFRSEYAEMFDAGLILIITILEIIFLAKYGSQVFDKSYAQEFSLDSTLWQLVKTINLLLSFRLIRLITHFKSMSLVLVSMVDIFRNLAPFGGLLLVLYYFFGILGMELFSGKITYTASNISDVDPQATYTCGSYEQLEYWANNFDDFAASLVVLWDVMVVNNWHIYLKVYSERVSPWSQLYFIIYWILSVIISVNLFTAIILENFIMRWDRHQSGERRRTNSEVSLLSTNPLSVHEMFRGDIKEPAYEELLTELRTHEHLKVSTLLGVDGDLTTHYQSSTASNSSWQD